MKIKLPLSLLAAASLALSSAAFAAGAKTYVATDAEVRAGKGKKKEGANPDALPKQ